MWTGFVKSRNNVRGKLGQLKLKLLNVGEENYQKINIYANYAHPLIFQWEINGHFAYVDLKQSCIRLAKKIKEVTENVCIGLQSQWLLYYVSRDLHDQKILIM